MTLHPHIDQPASRYIPGGAVIFQQMSVLSAQHSTINFAQGIPEAVFDDYWVTALTRAVALPNFQYTPSLGITELRAAIAAHYAIEPARAVVTSGCTEALAIALQALALRGYRRVVWAEPYYSFYPGMAAYAGLQYGTVALDTDSDRVRFDQTEFFAQMATPEPTVVLLNSPHNPTGAMLDETQWDELLLHAETTNSMILLDDAYHDFVYDQQLPNFQRLLDSGRVLIAGSISKSLAASGNRVGWLLVPEQLRQISDDAHMHMSYCVPAFMQYATVEVFDQVRRQDPVSGYSELERNSAHYRSRRDQVVRALSALGARVRVPDGGFFVTAMLPEAIASGSGAQQVQLLSREHGLTPLPLDLFYRQPPRDTWLRWSFAMKTEDVEEGCRRIDALAQM